jgi:hypothetical protein
LFIAIVYGPGERDKIIKLWIQEGLADSTRVRYEKSWALWKMHLTAEGHGFNSFLDGKRGEEFLKVLILFIRSICLGSRGSKTALEIAMSAVHSAFTQAGKCTDLFSKAGQEVQCKKDSSDVGLFRS